MNALRPIVKPGVRLEPTVVPAGPDVSVWLGDFAAGVPIYVYLDDMIPLWEPLLHRPGPLPIPTSFDKVTPDAHGRWGGRMKVPGDGPASRTGPHRIRVCKNHHSPQGREDPRDLLAEAMFLVKTDPKVSADWVQSGFDEAGARYNPFEKVLSPANASTLALAWRYAPLGPGYTGAYGNHFGQAVVANGVVYVVQFINSGPRPAANWSRLTRRPGRGSGCPP
jgi:hypothetical protein